jgi:hypothetical protein
MTANRMLPVPPFKRYNKGTDKSQLSVACKKRVSAQPLAAEWPAKSKKRLQHDKCRMSIDECRIKEFCLL